jgi:hypothetical protein
VTERSEDKSQDTGATCYRTLGGHQTARGRDKWQDMVVTVFSFFA